MFYLIDMIIMSNKHISVKYLDKLSKYYAIDINITRDIKTLKRLFQQYQTTLELLRRTLRHT